MRAKIYLFMFIIYNHKIYVSLLKIYDKENKTSSIKCIWFKC